MASLDFFLSHGLDVSRETFARLQVYGETLIKWQASHNLIAPSTIPSVWERHFLDSAQLVSYIPSSVKMIADLGSGAGFPGMVVAILTNIPTFLVESNQKKVSFLREVQRLTQAPVHVYADRVEDLPSLDVDLVTARALSSLSLLLSYSLRHLKKEGFCLFLKGKDVDKEIREAQKTWNFVEKKYSSITDCTGVILEIKEIRRGMRGRELT